MVGFRQHLPNNCKVFVMLKYFDSVIIASSILLAPCLIIMFKLKMMPDNCDSCVHHLWPFNILLQPFCILLGHFGIQLWLHKKHVYPISQLSFIYFVYLATVLYETQRDRGNKARKPIQLSLCIPGNRTIRDTEG